MKTLLLTILVLTGILTACASDNSATTGVQENGDVPRPESSDTSADIVLPEFLSE